MLSLIPMHSKPTTPMSDVACDKLQAELGYRRRLCRTVTPSSAAVQVQRHELVKDGQVQVREPVRLQRLRHPSLTQRFPEQVVAAVNPDDVLDAVLSVKVEGVQLEAGKVEGLLVERDALNTDRRRQHLDVLHEDNDGKGRRKRSPELRLATEEITFSRTQRKPISITPCGQHSFSVITVAHTTNHMDHNTIYI